MSDKIHYECFVTKTTHGRDIDNYATSSEEAWLEKHNTQGALYEALAKLKLSETVPVEHGDSYVTVSFGNIREVSVTSDRKVDMERLHETNAWQEHLRQAQALVEQATEEARQQADADERKDEAEYARLFEKFQGKKPNGANH